MFVLLTLAAVCVMGSVSDAFVVNTNRQPLISDGHSQYLGNLQGYNPVSAEQQGGSPNFQQPNVLTGQKVQIMSATSKPVFGVFGQQQPTQCLPTAPNMQQPAGASQSLYDYYNQLHATRQPFPDNLRPNNGANYGTGQYDHYNNKPPKNPLQQVTGTSGPLSVFGQPDHVPLSMTLTSQQGRPIYVSGSTTNNQQQPVLGAQYANGDQAPSDGPVNQQQAYKPRTTERPQNGPIGYQPINVIRTRRATRGTRLGFNPNRVANRNPTGYQAGRNQQASNNNNRQMGAPSYFTDPFKYQMDQNNNPIPHRNSGSNQQGVLAFSDPSIFLGGSGFGKAQGSVTNTVNIGTQTGGSAHVHSKHDDGKPSMQMGPKDGKVVTSETSTSTPSMTTNQGETQNEMAHSSSLNTNESSRKNDESLVQEVARFDPNKVNLAPFNFFDPSSMMSANGRGRRHILRRRAAGFDPSKMNAGTFEPSKMTAGSYDPASANGANSQNPSSHPPGHFDPSSMLSGSFNPGKGDAGQANPGSLQQQQQQQQPHQQQQLQSPEMQTPPGQSGPETGGSQTGSNSKPNPQLTQGQGYDPDHVPSGSSFVPGSGGLFDPSAWEDFIGKK